MELKLDHRLDSRGIFIELSNYVITIPWIDSPIQINNLSFGEELGILSIILTLFLALLSIYYTKYYSTVYHINGENKGKEMYFLLEKLELPTKSKVKDSARIILKKSSFRNASGFMDISIADNAEEIQLDSYSFIHSCIHNIIAPGKIILKPENTWEEKVKSNEFENFVIKSTQESTLSNYLPKKFKNKNLSYKFVKSEFSFPKTYYGPRYKKRILILAKGIGIIYSKTEYINGNIDIYKLTKWKIVDGKDYWIPLNKEGNFWEYDITYEFGPNKLNLSE